MIQQREGAGGGEGGGVINNDVDEGNNIGSKTNMIKGEGVVGEETHTHVVISNPTGKY